MIYTSDNTMKVKDMTYDVNGDQNIGKSMLRAYYFGRGQIEEGT